MLSELNKNQIIQNFQLQQTVDYHQETMKTSCTIYHASLRKASVLIGFVERGTGLNIIFTKRAKHLKHHPGQISFPGGKYEDWDNSLAETALKRDLRRNRNTETREITIFGQMPELITISQFKVTPFLAFVAPNYKPILTSMKWTKYLKSQHRNRSG